MKPSNILVTEQSGGWRYVLIDLADVRFRRPVTAGDRVRNLAQINTAVPRQISRVDRLRFLQRYVERTDAALSPAALWPRVMRHTSARGGVRR